MRAILALGALLVSSIYVGAAEKPIESYYARLSAEDHFNSAGERLTTAAAIIRQDRANFHVYGKRDREDDSDYTFSDKANRARLERMIANGHYLGGAESAVLNGTPLIYVEIYENYVAVSVRDD
ncbi:hypothetical protein [Brucella sp. NBRC 113783]|uniref:hypothetical protein n=1 Tax=Brucella sp. NBRC 113783 TaxID=3075478 RepID=UPI0029C01874|nr:hypothetical protein [Brucella sp. NBRC 113783]MDX4074930.1 hypothetical protein [Brucella sp. NBRC 113783]